VAEPEYGGHQHVEHLLLGLHVVLEETVSQTEPGVVHQHADRLRRVGEAVLHDLERGPVGEVGREHLHPGGVLLVELGRELVEALLVARHQHQVVSALGQCVRERATDARGGAGDERDRRIGGHGPTVGAGVADDVGHNEP